MNKEETFTVFGSAPGEPNFVLAIHTSHEAAEEHAEELRESARIQDLDEVYYGVIRSESYRG